MSVWAAALLGVAVRPIIYGFNYLFFLPVILPSEIPRLATHLPERVFPDVWKLLSFLRLPSWDGSLSLSLLSLFIFYISSYLLLKTMGCHSQCLMSSASIQKLFCRIFSAFKRSFDEFVGDKVVSPSYSSAILGPPLMHFLISPKSNIWILEVTRQNRFFHSAFE